MRITVQLSGFNHLIFFADVIEYEPNPVRRAAERVYHLITQPTDLGKRVMEAIQTIEEALNQYT